MAELEEWRVFIRDFSDLALARMAKELRRYPEDKRYLDEVLRELKSRDRGSVTVPPLRPLGGLDPKAGRSEDNAQSSESRREE